MTSKYGLLKKTAPSLMRRLAASLLVAAAASACSSDTVEETEVDTPEGSVTENVLDNPQDRQDPQELETPSALKSSESPAAVTRPIGQEQLILEEVVLLEPHGNREDSMVFMLKGRPPSPGFSEDGQMAALKEQAQKACNDIGMDPSTTETGIPVITAATQELSRHASLLASVSPWFTDQGQNHLEHMLRPAVSIACPEASWPLYTAEVMVSMNSDIWYVGMDVLPLAERAAVWAAWGSRQEVLDRTQGYELPGIVAATICLNAEAQTATPETVIDDYLEDTPGMRIGADQKDIDIVFAARGAALTEAIRKCPAVMWSMLSDYRSSDIATTEILRPIDPQ